MVNDKQLIERLNIMAPECGIRIVCADRTTREMNRDIRQAAQRISTLTAEVEGFERWARIRIWNELRGRGVSQDKAIRAIEAEIAGIRAALSSQTPPENNDATN